MRKSVMENLYNLYVENPKTSNMEACEILGVDNGTIRTSKYRLKQSGYIESVSEDEVVILKPYKTTKATYNQGKSEVITEMIDVYLEDFREQTTFVDRLQVGREIRLLLEKL